MTMMYLMHHAFRRDLAAFAAAAAATPVADREAWAALAAAGSCSRPRCTTTTAARTPACGRCWWSGPTTPAGPSSGPWRTSTAEIDPILEACAAGFARLADHADEDARAALAVRLVAGRERLAEHLRHEETEAIAIIQQVLTPAEWERLDEEVFRKGITFRRIVALVPWVLHEVPGPVRRQLFAEPGGRMHQVIWRLTRRRFERRERVAFRHVA